MESYLVAWLSISVRCKHDVRWQHLSQVKDVLFKPVPFFIANHNTTGYIRDQCCHLKDDVPLSRCQLETHLRVTKDSLSLGSLGRA